MMTAPTGEAGPTGVLTRPKSSRARRPVLLAALLVVVGGVFLWTHPDRTREVIAQVRTLPLWAPLAALALVFGQLAFQGLRLWAVVPRRIGLGPAAVVSDWTRGEWLNMFAPARGGDALKIVLIRRRQGSDSGALAATTGAVLADKVVDAISIVGLCAAGGLLRALEPRGGTLMIALAALASLALLVVVLLKLKASGSWLRSRQWLKDFATGFAALKDPARLAWGLLFAFGAWAIEGAALWILCSGLGITLTASNLLVALVALNVGIGVPLALANLGVYEAALTFGLVQAGVPQAAAIGIAVTHHAIQLVALNLAAAAVTLRGQTAPAAVSDRLTA